jgi:ankyrin repeat protein
MRRGSLPFLVVVSLLLLPTGTRAAGPPLPGVEQLIDALTQVADTDYGYSPSVTGSIFLPLDRHGQARAMLLYRGRAKSAPALRELVKRGAAAVPHLLAHLSDRRPTRIVIDHRNEAGPMLFLGEPVNRPPVFDESDLLDGLAGLFGGGRERIHRVTVGDLCYVALGQIVNRDYAAFRYQPTAIVMVSSPTVSPSLRLSVRKEWEGLTPARHRASLIADLVKPADPDQRIGACKRLAYYYPDALEPWALKLLALPTYDGCAVESFVQELRATTDARERRARFDAFVARHGPAARAGILRQLFTALEQLEMDEDFARKVKEDEPPDDLPRRLLVELCGLDRNVRSSRRPVCRALEASEKVALVEEGLVHDDSVKVDQAVRKLLLSLREDDTLALACMKRLAGRGYDADIERYCRRRLARLEGEEREPFQAMLGRLGWTRLHVAAEMGSGAVARRLLRAGAKVDAAARDGRVPLHLAAAAGRVDLARLLLDAGAVVDVKDRHGLTPGRLALRAGHEGVVKLLVGRGAAVPDIRTAAIAGKLDRAVVLLKKAPALARTRNERQQTPLHLAAKHGHADVAEVLLAHGAPVDAADEGGWRPLHLAAQRGHEAVVRVLLAHKADVRGVLPETRLEPLHLAAAAGRVRVAEALLAHKADVNARAGAGDLTPLHLAVRAGRADLVRLLLAASATADARDRAGKTPLFQAVEAGSADVVRALLVHRADVRAAKKGAEPLHVAAAGGRVELIELLLKHSAAVSAAEEESGETALHLAVRHGHREAAALLLVRGAPVNAQDGKGRTPLYRAAERGDEELVRLLLKHRADLRLATRSGAQPLHVAAWTGRARLVALLLKRGADVNVRTKGDATPLHVAAEHGRLEVARLLLDRGARVNAWASPGGTPLHRAAASGHEAVVRLLLARKANVRAAGKGGEPLHAAAFSGSARVIDLLLRAGADVNARDAGCCTPLHHAASWNSREVVELLLARKAEVAVKDREGQTPLDAARERPGIARLLRKHGAKK